MGGIQMNREEDILDMVGSVNKGKEGLGNEYITFERWEWSWD